MAYEDTIVPAHNASSFDLSIPQPAIPPTTLQLVSPIPSFDSTMTLPSISPTPVLPTTLNINAQFHHPLIDANFFKWHFHFKTILHIHRLGHILEGAAPLELLSTDEPHPIFEK